MVELCYSGVMIITKETLVTISPTNLQHFITKGYQIPKSKDSRGRVRTPRGTKIKVKLEDLQPKSSALIDVQCEDCGKIRTVEYNTVCGRINSQFLKTGETPCSNCANKRMSGVNNAQYKHGNNQYCFYRHGAKRRGYVFNLTIEEFEQLTNNTCYYCGKPSKGVDRWDNTKGYDIENCVPCCKRCNYMKQAQSPLDFLSHVKNIYLTRIQQNEI